MLKLLKVLRIATRKSVLAQIQANQVKALLQKACPDLGVELVFFSTQGDEVLDRPLAEIGGKALFIKTLEEALLQDKADIAVHSLKDVPAVLGSASTSPGVFCLLAYLDRENPADVFLSQNFSNFLDLPLGASVGTSSPRRSAQLLHWRADLNIKMLRGNVPTRVDKILSGEFDAGVLAYAGLNRLGLISKASQVFSTDFLLPAAGQGIIAVECLSSRQKEFECLKHILNNPAVEKIAIAERSFVARLGGDCYSPIAALADIQGDELVLRGSVLSSDGAQIYSGVKKIKNSNLQECEKIGILLAEECLISGAGELLKCH